MVSEAARTRVSALHTVRHVLAAAALREFLAIEGLDRARILVVKGMSTSSILYAHPSERPLSDVDVRTTRRDLAVVVQVARRRGIAADWSSAQLGTVAVRIAGVDIELESTIGPPGVCAVSVGEMLGRAASREIAPGLVALVPEIHDHALQLALNVFKDLLLSPAWSVEDARRIVRLDSFDPTRFVALVRRAKCAGAVGLVATWLAETGESPEWSELRDALTPPRANAVYARLFHAAGRHDVRHVLRTLVAHGGSDTLTGTLHGLAAGAFGALRWKIRQARGTLVEHVEAIRPPIAPR